MDIEKIKESFEFSHTSTTPLYMQLASFFKICIQSEVLKIDEQLPTEESISKAYGISRTTVRQTMDLLIKEGYLLRVRGKGSFVTPRKLNRSINRLYSFTSDIKATGAVPSSKVLEACIVKDPPEYILGELHLPGSQKTLFKLVRLRCSDSVPILIEETYIPYYLCNGIETYSFERNSLYDVLTKQYGLNLYHATEYIEAVSLKDKEKKMLQCSCSAGFKIYRIASLESGFSFEYTTSITRGDRSRFHLDLYNTPNSEKNIKLNFF